jgi:hypothetical protein
MNPFATASSSPWIYQIRIGLFFQLSLPRLIKQNSPDSWADEREARQTTQFFVRYRSRLGTQRWILRFSAFS